MIDPKSCLETVFVFNFIKSSFGFQIQIRIIIDYMLTENNGIFFDSKCSTSIE